MVAKMVANAGAFLGLAFGQVPADTYILRCHSRRRGPAVYRTAQLVLVAILAVVFGLSALSRRFPHVAWLQVFRYDRPQLSQDHQARMRQRSNIYAGVELILMGIILPMVYFVGTVMFFNQPTTTGTVLSLGGSVLLIGLGATAIWHNRRR